MSDKEMGSFYAYINTIPDQMKITFHAIAKQLTVNNNNFEVACWSYIFPKRPRTSPDTVRHSSRKLGGRKVFSFIRWIHHRLVVIYGTDLLKGLAIKAMYGYRILFKNRYIQIPVQASILIWWWHLHFLLTLTLLDVCMYCRLLSFRFWYLAFCKTLISLLAVLKIELLLCIVLRIQNYM